MDISNIDKGAFNFIAFSALGIFIVALFGIALYVLISSAFPTKRKSSVVKLSKEASNEIEDRVNIKNFFKRLQKIYATKDLILYKGAKSGESFLVALKFKNSSITNLDLLTIKDVAKENHIYNKFFITNEDLYADPLLAKTVEDCEIMPLSGPDLCEILKKGQDLS